MTMHRYPDHMSIRLPTGWRRRVEHLAALDERSPAAWLRQLIRRALEAGERADRRRRAAAAPEAD